MGKRIIPPNDPDRLARVMDERRRLMGVDVVELDRQASEKRRQQKEEEIYNLRHGMQQIKWEQEVLRRQQEAQECQRTLDRYVAERQQEQILDKCKKDAYLQELYSNRIDDSYFKQFGTSHR